MAQSVEHVIGNDEVISSILITSSRKATQSGCFSFSYKKPKAFSTVGEGFFIWKFNPYTELHPRTKAS